MRMAGSSEKRLIGMVSAVVGVSSAFMQNIGAAALFLPALVRISKKTKIPVSRFFMPMGFAAILGGTVSMVGSGPHIKGTINIPLSDLRTRYKELDPDAPTVLICSTGHRSSTGASILKQHDFRQIFNVGGGIVGILLGAGIFAAVYPKAQGAILNKGDFGELTLPKLLKVNAWVVVIPAAVLLAALLFWLEKAGL